MSPQLMLAMANATREVEDINHIQRARRNCYHQTQRACKRRTRQPLGQKTPKRWGWTAKTTIKQPATMYQWRAVGNLRVTFADVILGWSGKYTPDGMGAVVD